MTDVCYPCLHAKLGKECVGVSPRAASDDPSSEPRLACGRVPESECLLSLSGRPSCVRRSPPAAARNDICLARIGHIDRCARASTDHMGNELAASDGWMARSICRASSSQLPNASAADRPQHGGEDASLGADCHGIQRAMARFPRQSDPGHPAAPRRGDQSDENFSIPIQKARCHGTADEISRLAD
jgi:hypothetical protein